MKRYLRAGAAGLALAVLALVAGAPPAGAGPVRLPAAGADLVSIAVAGDALALRARDAGQVARGEPGHDPADVTLGPDGGLAGRVPAGAGFGFLGAPGTPVWSLSAGDPAFPALDTTGVRRGAVAGDAVTLALRSATGPGDFAAYTLTRFGAPAPLLATGPGAPTGVRLPAGARTGSLVWAFTAAGEYRLTFAASATLASGRSVTAEATYRVEVPRIVPPAGAPLPRPAIPRTPDPASARQAVTGQAALAAPGAAQAPAPVQAPPVKAAATNGSRKVFADGHVDMGPQLSGDSWAIRIRDDTVSPPVWREVADVVLHVVDKAKITVPAGPDYAFLGAEGDSVWLLPQAQQAGIVWPGWNTQHESVVGGMRGEVTWTLNGVDGPGQLKLFLTGSFGKPTVLFDSAKSLPQRMSIPLNTHAHGNYAFTKPGIYRLTVAMSGTTTSGKAVTDTKTLAIAVGDGVDPNSAFGPGSGTGTGNGDGGGGRLPRTGESWVIPVSAGGVVLLAVGVLLVFLARRRRTGNADPAGDPS